MTQKNEENFCCDPKIGIGGLKVESVLSIDKKGQILLPKDVRDKMGIDTERGDKLVLISMGNPDNLCCLTLMKADNFGDIVKDFLGPIMKDLFSSNMSKN